MNETALQALYKAVATRLRDPDEPWGVRAYVSTAKASKIPVIYPYVVYFWSGGGATSSIIGAEATFRLSVKCVSDKLSVAMRGAARISALLDEQGEQDGESTPVEGGDEWFITSITEGETIYMVQATPDTVPIYHCGAVYRVVMEAL